MRWCSCHKQSMIVRWNRVSVLTQQKFTYPSGINGTMEISFDVPTFADVDKEYDECSRHGSQAYHGTDHRTLGTTHLLRCRS